MNKWGRGKALPYSASSANEHRCDGRNGHHGTTTVGRLTQTGVAGECHAGTCRAGEGGAGHGGTLHVCFHSHTVNGVLSAAYVITYFFTFLCCWSPQAQGWGAISLVPKHEKAAMCRMKKIQG